jgi:murein DD-endopeptidase MepM/ murein hydrolase activator NlpD
MSSLVVSDSRGRWSLIRQIFRDRDLMVHDGANLHRMRMSARVQMVGAAALVALTAWAVVAIVQIVVTATLLSGAAVSAAERHAQISNMEDRVAALQFDVVKIKQEATRHAAILEKRQAFLAALLTGQGDAAKLASLMPVSDDAPSDLARDVVAPFKSVEEQQVALAARAEGLFAARAQATETMMARLGISSGKMQQVSGAMGGPLESADLAPKPVLAGQADPQFRSLFNSWKKLDQLQQAVVAIPSLKPVDAMVFTSGFGIRSDPFRGGAAMHAGVDIPGPYASPIYATADGIVERSQWAGGYGNLVELSHGRGIETRYGHLSASLVSPGQRVKRGQMIARMGSTGRSTGNHLHYEVRVDGSAINPMPFLQSTDYLVALQRRGANEAVAVGGPSSAK